MSKITYPRPLRKGDKIAITAPSCGVRPAHHPRLELVLNHLRHQGFDVVEGTCLREWIKHTSGPREQRAQELLSFWEDESISAIMPPWGGELLAEILPLLDFEKMKRSRPKWISGYSDVSTLLFPITVRLGIATVHGANLMDLAPSQTDPLTTGLISTLSLAEGDRFEQHSSTKFQKEWLDFEKQVGAPLQLSEDTHWKALQHRYQKGAEFTGRLIGGCLDTIARLVGTPYGDLPSFKDRFSSEGVIFYFENCELVPCELARTLWNLRLAGWFSGLSGILIGRSAGPDAKDPGHLQYVEALQSVLGDLPAPVIYDADIGHRPPQLNLINGSIGEVIFTGQAGTVTQVLK